MTEHQKSLPKVKLGCDYCGKETTGRVYTCDGGTAICCRECKKELRHDHDEETGECLLWKIAVNIAIDSEERKI